MCDQSCYWHFWSSHPTFSHLSLVFTFILMQQYQSTISWIAEGVFAPCTRLKLVNSTHFEVPNTPLTALESIDLEAILGTGGKNTSFEYITYLNFELMPSAVRTYTLYDHQMGWSKQVRFQVPENEDLLSVTSERFLWPATAICVSKCLKT